MNPRGRLLSRLTLWFLAALGGAGAATAQQSYPTFRLAGFADVNLGYSTRSGATELEFGELDPYAEACFSDSWSAIGEALFQRIERGSSADRPGGRSVELDLERLFVAYSRSDALRLQVGEINSGIIGWNEREQLPRFLQTPIDVPSIARRSEQGGAWPLHLLGLWAWGTVPGSGGLRYGAGVGKGRGRSREDTPLGGGPTTAALLASVSFAPDAVPGWSIGAAALLDRIPAPEGNYREIDETFSTNFVRGPAELRAEWGRMDHRRAGEPHVTRGGYALLSWRLPGQFSSLRPYLLIDRLDVARDEPYLAELSNQRAWSAGVRWDVTAHLVVKIDFQSQRERERSEERRARLQVAAAF
jgi:hypothetical protein